MERKEEEINMNIKKLEALISDYRQMLSQAGKKSAGNDV